MTTTDSSGYGATFPTETTSDSSTKDVAKEQAGQVAGTAKEQATHVAGTAKEQASEVAGTATEKAGQVADTAKEQVQEVVAEATSQMRNVAGELKSQVTEQAGTQRDRIVDQLRAVGDELTQMIEGGGSQSGIAGELATQLNTRVTDLAGYLEGHEPSDILVAVQDYARRKPGTFLLGSALAGLVAGRLTRGARAAMSDDSSGTSSGYAYAPSVPASTYSDATYAQPTYAAELPSSTYPTTVSSAGGFSTTTGYDEPAAGYVSGAGVDTGVGTQYDDTYGTTGSEGQRL